MWQASRGCKSVVVRTTEKDDQPSRTGWATNPRKLAGRPHPRELAGQQPKRTVHGMFFFRAACRSRRRPLEVLMVSAALVLPFALRLLLAKKRVFALRGMMARVRVTPYRKVLADGSMFTVAVLCYVAYMVLDAPLHGFAKRE